jgi:hypothetical protein
MIAVTPSLPSLIDLSHAQKDELIVALFALFAQVQSLMTEQALRVSRVKKNISGCF